MMSHPKIESNIQRKLTQIQGDGDYLAKRCLFLSPAGPPHETIKHAEFFLRFLGTHIHPSSISQQAEHPSPLSLLSSSHSSPASVSPLPKSGLTSQILQEPWKVGQAVSCTENPIQKKQSGEGRWLRVMVYGYVVPAATVPAINGNAQHVSRSSPHFTFCTMIKISKYLIKSYQLLSNPSLSYIYSLQKEGPLGLGQTIYRISKTLISPPNPLKMISTLPSPQKGKITCWQLYVSWLQKIYVGVSPQDKVKQAGLAIPQQAASKVRVLP